MKKFWKRTEGFTLVELIVVIAILGILAGVGTVGYSGYVKKANMAADETLLGAINTAFATACVDNGVNIYEVATSNAQIAIDETDGTWEVTTMTHNGKNLAEDFEAYMGGNTVAEFRVIRGLYYHTDKGMFEVTESVDGYNYLTSDVDAWKAGILGDTMNAADMLTLVDTSVNQVADIYANAFANATGSTSFKNAASAMLGKEYQAYIDAEKEATYNAYMEGKDPNDPIAQIEAEAAVAAREKELNANLMVAVSANKANEASSNILDVLKGTDGTDAKTAISNNLVNDSNAATGISQAALAYGLYTSYVKWTDPTAEPDLVDFEDALEGENAGFNSYLNGTLAGSDVSKDLDGLMGALNTIGLQNSGIIESAVTGGFNNSDLAEALSKILGEA